MIKPWKTLESEIVIDDPWLKLRKDKCETQDGVIVEPYWVQECTDWVHAVVLNDEEEVLMIQQYRHGIKQVNWEVPAGTIEDGESPVETMHRELLEEAGCKVEKLIPLRPASPSPARQTNQVHAFLGYGGEIVQEQNLDPSENIEASFVSIPEVFKLIEEEKFVSTIQLPSFYEAMIKLGKLEVNL